MRDELRGTGLMALMDRDGRGFLLFPDAFASERELAATLGHERTHAYQYAVFGPPSDTVRARAFEAAAIESEAAYLSYLDAQT